jgi:predicted DsbA family dithiol-disulfide isomerase
VERLRVPVYYDFASTICYVAHRVMERLASSLEELEIDLAWSPVDLARLSRYQRGETISESSRTNAARIAQELAVPVRIPSLWLDSRALNSAAIAADELGSGEIWRERVWTTLFEEGRLLEDAEDVAALARQAGLSLGPEAIARAHGELERRTSLAASEMVAGVPTFMLGRWPFGGIQQPDTMRMVLERFATRRRAGELR